jgi:putative spermidine/putrescine transport system permease protein/spermidine/putrescine transport system permease protein
MRTPLFTSVLLVGLTTLVMLAIYGPIAVTVAGAFFETNGGSIVLSQPSLKSFAALGSDASVLKAFGNTLLVGVAASSLAVIIGLSTSLYYASRKNVGRSLLQFLIFVPFVMPPMITGLSLLIFFREVGIDRSLMTVIMGHVVILLAIAHRLIVVRLMELRESLTEAALDLGASHFQAFYMVVLPNLKSAIAAAFILCFALSFDETLVTILVSGGEQTFPVRLWAMMRLGFAPSVNAIVVIVLTTATIVSFIAIRQLMASSGPRHGLGSER